MEFVPRKAEQSIQCMKLTARRRQRLKDYRNFDYKEPKDNRCLLTLRGNVAKGNAANKF